MAKNNRKPTQNTEDRRRLRMAQILFAVMAVMIIFSMVASLVVSTF